MAGAMAGNPNNEPYPVHTVDIHNPNNEPYPTEGTAQEDMIKVTLQDGSEVYVKRSNIDLPDTPDVGQKRPPHRQLLLAQKWLSRRTRPLSLGIWIPTRGGHSCKTDGRWITKRLGSWILCLA
jgi:hypothetical protein